MYSLNLKLYIIEGCNSLIAIIFGILLAGSITPASYAVFNYEHVDTFGRFGILYEGRMSHPQHIAEDSEGNLYVTDLGNKRVQKFASEGVYLDQWDAVAPDQESFTSLQELQLIKTLYMLWIVT